MACFLVPAAEAIVTSAISKANEKKLQQTTAETTDHIAEATNDTTTNVAIETKEPPKKNPFLRKLRWLSYMLWGGAILLCFEHIWHGEVVPYPPFLTAASSPTDTAEMLHEMSTVGVTMAILVTAVWLVMVLVTNAIENRPDAEIESVSQEG